LENNIEEGLTCFNFPRKHWIKIKTTNGLERINREIKRIARVTVLFPNAEAALKLVTGVLIEIHEDWLTDKIYLKMEEKKLNIKWLYKKMKSIDRIYRKKVALSSSILS
jgi:transposase-like protein